MIEQQDSPPNKQKNNGFKLIKKSTKTPNNKSITSAVTHSILSTRNTNARNIPTDVPYLSVKIRMYDSVTPSKITEIKTINP